MQRHGARELGVVLRRGPIPARLAAFCGQLADGADRDLHLLVAEDHRAQHDLLGQALGLGLDHQHGVLGAGDYQVQLRGGEVFLGRIQQVLPVPVADARRADRAVEGKSRERERRRGAEERRDVGVDVRIHRQHGRDDLHVVEEAVREERADRAVDEARGERLLLGRTALALEEAARDAPRGVGLLDVVDGEREEVPPRRGGCSWRRR